MDEEEELSELEQFYDGAEDERRGLDFFCIFLIKKNQGNARSNKIENFQTPVQLFEYYSKNEYLRLETSKNNGNEPDKFIGNLPPNDLADPSSVGENFKGLGCLT